MEKGIETKIFRYKFSQDEVSEIILRHMIIEGMIRENERENFSDQTRAGSKLVMEFIVKTKEYENYDDLPELPNSDASSEG